jgi:hypothetical protein
MAGIDIEGLAPVYPDGVRAVDGLESATEGTVRIDPADVTRVEPGKRGVTMVFQDYALFPHMAVNITYPLSSLDARLPDSDGSGGSVSVAGGSLPAATGSVPAGAEVTVGARPEYLVLSTGDVTGPSQPVAVA